MDWREDEDHPCKAEWDGCWTVSTLLMTWQCCVLHASQGCTKPARYPAGYCTDHWRLLSKAGKEEAERVAETWAKIRAEDDQRMAEEMGVSVEFDLNEVGG